MSKPKRKPRRTPANCRKWGAAGGTARAARMTAAQRSESARMAARARWGKGANRG